jgi:DNA-binding NarL/FixJ family response regulator
MLADDYTPFRQDLKRILEERKDLKVIGEAGDGLELLTLYVQHSIKPNMVILDISMPKLSGIEAARRLKMIDPNVKILILTIHQEKEYLDWAVAAGVHGYLLKGDANTDLFSAIERIRQGELYISPHLFEKGMDRSVPEA